MKCLAKKLLQGKLISLQYYHEVDSDALYCCGIIVKMDSREFTLYLRWWCWLGSFTEFYLLDWVFSVYQLKISQWMAMKPLLTSCWVQLDKSSKKSEFQSNSTGQAIMAVAQELEKVIYQSVVCFPARLVCSSKHPWTKYWTQSCPWCIHRSVSVCVRMLDKVLRYRGKYLY